MRPLASRRLRTTAGCALVLATGIALAGCGSATAPIAERPVALATVVAIDLPSSFPDPTFDATSQLGGLVRLSAEASHDPSGQSLSYEWTDTVDGLIGVAFGPSSCIRTSAPTAEMLLSVPGEHEITLTVTARDGRKATTSVRVLVTGCEC